MTLAQHERIQDFTYVASRKIIIGAGRKGGLVKFSEDLQVLSVSNRTEHHNPISRIIVVGDRIFTRNNLGTVMSWDINTLTPISVLVTSELFDETSVLSMSHGLHHWQGKLYVVAGSGNVLELDPATLEVLRVMNPNEESFIESFDTQHPTTHVFSDFSGWIWKGSLESGAFEKFARVDKGVSHCVTYDSRHDRYWASTDNSKGFALVNRLTGEVTNVAMTNDDVEWIALDQSAEHAFVACFDHHLYVFSNQDTQPRLKKAIGPFKFQLKRVQCAADGRLFVLLESGEIYVVTQDGKITESTAFEGRCVWAMTPSHDEADHFLLALEDGSVRKIQAKESRDSATPIVIERATYNYAWGRVRRVKSLPGKRFAAITTSGVVFCAEEGGALLWQRKIPSIPRDLDVSPCGKFLAVGSEANYAEELSLSDGSTQRIFQVDAPIWSLCYLPNGRLLLGTRGKKLLLVEAGCLLPAQSIPVYDNAKSMQLTAQKTVVVNGPGYIVEYDAETLEKIRSWSEGLTTTCEAVTLLGDRVYGLSYNLVLSTFNYQSTELLNEQTTVHDFPKAIQTWTGPSGSTHLLVAGRGAYVATYHLRSEAPVKNFELFLSHDNMRSL